MAEIVRFKSGLATLGPRIVLLGFSTGALIIACSTAGRDFSATLGSGGGQDASSGNGGALASTSESAVSSTSSTSATSATGSGGATTTSSSSTGGPATCIPVQGGCAANEYCDSTSCSTLGTCTPRPTSSPTNWAPACGCDGVIYWNADHAAFLGVTTFTPGGGNPVATCFNTGLSPKSCDAAGNGCSGGLESCVRLYGIGGTGSCSGPLLYHSCWSKPIGAQCPACVVGNRYYRQCNDTCECECQADLLGQYKDTTGCDN